MTRTSWDLTGLTNRSWSSTKMIQRPSFADLIPVPAYSHPGPLGLDAVYRYLVSNQHKNELQSVGVMGSISFGYHPESGTPTFFVHPCNTADAMRCIAGQQAVNPDTYLIIWLGLVGSRLGLHLPSAIFVANDQARTQGK